MKKRANSAMNISYPEYLQQLDDDEDFWNEVYQQMENRGCTEEEAIILVNIQRQRAREMD